MRAASLVAAPTLSPEQEKQVRIMLKPAQDLAKWFLDEAKEQKYTPVQILAACAMIQEAIAGQALLEGLKDAPR